LISLRTSGNEAVRRRCVVVDVVVAVIMGLLRLFGESLDLVLVMSDDRCCSGCVVLAAKLAVVAGPRLGPACVLRGSVEPLMTVLIGLFVIIASDSGSRLRFDLQVPFNARGCVFLPFLVGAMQPAAGTLPQPADTW
jgi:hypothetical protein